MSIENKGNPFGDQHDCPATADRVFALSLEESVRYFAANPDVENYCLLECQVFHTRTPLNHEWDVSPIVFSFSDEPPLYDEEEIEEHIDAAEKVFPEISFLAIGYLDAWMDATTDSIEVRPAMWVEC